MSWQPHWNDRPGFFVGYFKTIPASLAVFVLAVGGLLTGAFAALAFTLAYGTDTPPAAVFTPDTAVTGYYRAEPYPMVQVAPDKTHPQGRSLLLSGDGKSGAQSTGNAFAGKAVDVSGFHLKRGDVDMLIIERIAAAATAPVQTPGAAVALGHWQVSGEVCDGKCLAGAMKPGTGLAHKACANLCIAGGLPPILVTAQPVEGARYMLLANASGGAVVPGMWEHTVGRPVILEGMVERVGDLLIMRADWAKARFP